MKKFLFVFLFIIASGLMTAGIVEKFSKKAAPATSQSRHTPKAPAPVKTETPAPLQKAQQTQTPPQFQEPIAPQAPQEKKDILFCDRERANQVYLNGVECFNKSDFECAFNKFSEALDICPTHNDAQFALRKTAELSN